MAHFYTDSYYNNFSLNNAELITSIRLMLLKQKSDFS